MNLIPLRSNGMWLPVTITLAIPETRPWWMSAGVGIVPAFSTLKPASSIARAAAAMMRGVLGRRSPAIATASPGAI